VTYFGIDVSSHNGTINWGSVAGAGVDFAFARAMLCTRPDYTFATNLKGMRAAGIIPGAYHFLYARRFASPESQCDAFLAKIGDPDGMLVALDVEKDGESRPDMTDVSRWVTRFRAKHPTHPLVIYTGRWYWDSDNYPIHDANGAKYGPLWLSRYSISLINAGMLRIYATVPSAWWTTDFGGWAHPTILQYASQGRVAGVSGDVDVNAFRGTRGQLVALTGPTGIALPDTSTEGSMASAIRVENRRVASDSVIANKPGTILYRDEGITKVRTLDERYLLDDFGVPTGVSGFRAVAIKSGQFDSDDARESGIALMRDQDVDAGPRPKTAAELRATAEDFYLGPVTPPAPVDTTPFDQADVDAKVAAAIAAFELEHADDEALLEAYRKVVAIVTATPAP
jgi:lysozyme